MNRQTLFLGAVRSRVPSMHGEYHACLVLCSMFIVRSQPGTKGGHIVCSQTGYTVRSLPLAVNQASQLALGPPPDLDKVVRVSHRPKGGQHCHHEPEGEHGAVEDGE